MSQYSSQLSPISVDAVLKVIDPNEATNVDLHWGKKTSHYGTVVPSTIKYK